MASATETHHPHGLEVCIDCGQHEDARVHHTPERLAGAVGPAVGARMRQNPIEQGAVLLAAALKPRGARFGWGPLAGPATAALRDLIAAGWTPPTSESDDESTRLRAEIARLCAANADLARHIDRLGTERTALEEFRGAVVQAAHPCGRNPLRLDSGRTYSAADVQAIVSRLLAEADRCAQSHRGHAAKQAEGWAAQRERTQLALFEPPAASEIEDVPVEAAQAVGL